MILKILSLYHLNLFQKFFLHSILHTFATLLLNNNVDVKTVSVLLGHADISTTYNTYIHEGLPPGPIKIASIKGIDAVLNAVNHDYLYMCAKEDFSGTHNFAKTYPEHLQNAEKYTKALNERGIK